MAVQGVDADGDHRTGGDMKTTDLVVADGAPPHDPGRGKEPQTFVQHLPQIRQASQVCVCGRTSAKLLLNFTAHPFGCPRVLREQVLGPGQGVGGGFVAGEQQSPNLTLKLPVIHCCAALFVPSSHQRAEQVALILKIPAVPGRCALPLPQIRGQPAARGDGWAFREICTPLTISPMV